LHIPKRKIEGKKREREKERGGEKKGEATDLSSCSRSSDFRKERNEKRGKEKGRKGWGGNASLQPIFPAFSERIGELQGGGRGRGKRREGGSSVERA